MKIHLILVLYLVYLSHSEADARALTTNHNQGILNPTLSTPPEPSFLQKTKQPTNRDILEIVGLGSDIAIGSDGTLWRISTEPEDGGRSIYRLDEATNTWVKIPGAGVRIAVDYDGTAWITNDKNAIFHYNGTGWEQVQGSGLDIAAGGNSVWHIDAKNAIWRLSEDRESWEQVPGSATRITADGDGNAWMVTKDHSIYKWTGSEWKKMPGQATDIGAGDDGTVYIAGTEKVAGGYQVWIWNEETHEWDLIYGIGATQVAVDSDGLLYAVKDDYRMFKLKNPDVRPRWKSVRREARDIGVGGDGTVWIVGTESKDDGYEIFKKDSDSNKWSQVEGAAATNIAVDVDGNAWIVDNKNQIMKYNGETWILLEGQGFDIGVGAENSVWHIGNNDEIFRLRTDKTAWNKVTGAKGERISVDENGNAWVVTRDNKIYKYGARWELIEGHAVDVACGADGTVVIAGNVSGKVGHQVSRWDKSTKTWIEIPGVTATRVAVGPTGDVYAINDSYEIYSLRRFW